MTEQIINWLFANPLLVVISLLVLYVIFTYNNLNSKKNRVLKSFSTIDVYLQKRFDEITSLLDQLLVAYDHEETVFKDISAYRTGIDLSRKGSVNDKVNTFNNISNIAAVPGIRTEDYPVLDSIKSLGTFTAGKTSEVESQIAAARNQYNSNATSFNTKITSFPAMLIAGILGFKEPFALFKAAEEAKERPKVASADYISEKYKKKSENL